MTAEPRITAGVLDKARFEGDAYADALIEGLFAAGYCRESEQVYQGVWSERTAPAGPVREAWQSFLGGMQTVQPVHGDLCLLTRGRRVFADWGPQIVVALTFGSLAGGYSAYQVSSLLYGVSRLQNDAERRVFETLQFLFDVMDERGLEPGGKGIESAQRVRLMHAGIRHLMRVKASRFNPGDRVVAVGAPAGLPVRPEPGTHLPASATVLNGTEARVVDGPRTVNGYTFWEISADQSSVPVCGWAEGRNLLGDFGRNGAVYWSASWGACINQEHMLGTILVMSVHVVDCLEKQWVKLRPEDQWAYIYTWLHVGRIMGVKEELIPRDLQEAKALWALVRQRQYRYSRANVDLQRALIRAVAPLFPRYFERSGPPGYVCKLNGPDVARKVGIRRTWGDRFWFALWFGVQRVLTWLEVRSSFLRRHLASAATTIIRNLRNRNLAGGAQFEVPTALAGKWALEGQGFTPWARQVPVYLRDRLRPAAPQLWGPADDRDS